MADDKNNDDVNDGTNDGTTGGTTGNDKPGLGSSGETIIEASITEKMRTSYLEYSMSVIISRALPDVRDGLKPVHRRVLTAMNDLNLAPGKPYRKSAKITGDTTGNYHPHGTTAVYDTLVRLAQDFSLRYPLVDGQGNFGSVDGDNAAAERYTEARFTKFATEIMTDLEKETVDFIPNYDGSRMMPAVMPSKVPNLLVNGADGIAVGMATKIPPHNMGEVCDGLFALLDNPDLQPEDMLQFVEGPDFPTGGIIHGRRGIYNYITTGRGRVVVRARTEIEIQDNGKPRIIVSELPYQVNKASLIEKIAGLVRTGVLEGITDLRDESDRDGMRIVIVMRKDIFPQVLLNKLYSSTMMQNTFGVINLALVNHQPKVMNLKETMMHFLNFREEVIVRRTQYELSKAEARAHILEGYRIALDNIDEIVELIKKSASVEAARLALIDRFTLSEIQAQAILDLKLARLTGMERQKIEDEYAALMVKITDLRAILADRNLVLAIVREELTEVRDRYADPRRTTIVEDEGEIDIEDLIADEPMVVTISNQGYAKRISLDTYRQQGRGGKGITAMGTKDEDFVDNMFIASTHQFLLVITQKGQLYWLKVHRIPQTGRTSKGMPLVNLIQIQPGDKIHAIVPVREFSADSFLVFATNLGIVKRTPLIDFSRPRQAGIRAINLLEDEHLISVRESDGDSDIIMAGSSGLAIRFHETDCRSMGRTARGVRGLALRDGQEVIGMVVVKQDDIDSALLSITANGYGKRTPLSEYRIQRRGGKGLITIKCSDRNGSLVGVRDVRPSDELMVITKNGIIIRISLEAVSLQSRNTQGVRILKFKGDDSVGSIAKISEAVAIEAAEASGEGNDVDGETGSEAGSETVAGVIVESTDQVTDETIEETTEDTPLDDPETENPTE